MVSNDTLKNIAAVLDDIQRGTNSHFYNRMNTYGVMKEIRARDRRYDSGACNNYQNIFMRLFALNAQAIMARYRDNGEDMIPEIDIDDIPKKPELTGGVIAFEPMPMHNPAALYKSIQCYLYQCSESDEIMNSHEFKACERLKNALACAAIEKTPAYEAADWN